MRYCFLLLSVSVQVATAQVVLNTQFRVADLKAVAIEFEKKKASVEEPSFTSFAIRDLRTDSITTGYVKFGSEFKKYFRLEFEKGIQSPVNFLHQYFRRKPDADSLRLVIFLKNFFITQDYKMPSTGVNLVNDVYTSKVFIAARLVVQKKNAYYYIGDVDTLITLNKWLGKSYNTLAQSAFIHLITKAENYCKVPSAREVEFSAFVESSFIKTPDFNTLADGFYKTYADVWNRQPVNVDLQWEQKKKVRLMKLSSLSDTAIVNHSWGFVEKGALYVRNGNVFIPMQSSYGSISGLGVGVLEVYKMPSVIDPIFFAIDVTDIAVNGATTKFEPFKLFKLNQESGSLE